MIGNAAGAIAGAALDETLGEPPTALHPVVHFGALMGRIERAAHRDDRTAGAALTATGVGVALATGVALRRAVGPVAATAIATALCSAGRMLDREALAIGDALAHGDIATARERVPTLVGRSPDALDAAEIARAVIESVAENCVDAVTAPIVWAAAGGAPAVLAHRAINTLDAMVGHRSERYARFGWASARLDDLANYVPARLTALATAIARPRRAHEIVRVVRRDARHHPSPNGGVVEATFAAALGLRLGGVNRYGDRVEDRGTLGDGRAPAPADIAAAVRLRRHTTLATCALVSAVAVLARCAHTARCRS